MGHGYTAGLALQTLCMNATFLKRWTTWLLPLLVLRAFFPVGFMLSSGPQGLQLMFCPGVMQSASGHSAGASTAAADSHHQDSHEGNGQHGESHEQHEHAPCPYGLAGAAAAAEPIQLVLDRVTADVATALPATPALDRSPVRTEPIRGPPSDSLKALI